MTVESTGGAANDYPAAKDVNCQSDWDKRFCHAISRYKHVGGFRAELFTALIDMITVWAEILPQSDTQEGEYILANSWGLAAEKVEIFLIVDKLALLNQRPIADSLKNKFQSLLNAAENLDKLYPLTSVQDQLAEKRLTKLCQRQAAVLCNYLDSLRERFFKQDRKDVDMYRPASNKIHVAAKTYFPLPEGITWPQITIQFKDGHVISARAGDAYLTYHFSELGMINKRNAKPNRQWELLRAFAENHGLISWRSSEASMKLKKQKQQLSLRLQFFFQQDTHAIEWSKRERGYRCKFQILA